jgi:predicted DNA-binding protein
MRFFFRKKDQPRHVEPPVTYHVQLSGRNYEELEECDVALKFWLPESIEKKIDEMSSVQNTSTSDLVRQILFIHLYGRYDLFGLVERKGSAFTLRQPPMYSRVRQVPDPDAPPPKPVEKSIADFKVWIPAKMKADIQALAQKAGKKPSLYVRQVIVTHLFGHVPPEGMAIDMLPPDGHIEDTPD